MKYHLNFLRVPGRQSVSAAAAFAIALILLSAGIKAPFAKDQEPQNAQWVVDIVQHGHWLLPHEYYGYVERKPPLFYWIAAVAVEASGGHVTEALARMPSLIAGAAIAAEVMFWTAAAIDPPPGWLAILFLLGMYGFASRATLVLTDMLMTFLMLTAYYLLRPMLSGDARPGRVIACGMFLGLAILAKGPIALVLVGTAALIYLLLTRSHPLLLLTRLWPWTVVAIALGIAALWYVPAFITGRSSDLAGVFVAENFGHFLPAAIGGTGEASRP
ncbi:MAG: glycosyltransferase family 39 protein, partial [Candidatus Binataceae bacterium]